MATHILSLFREFHGVPSRKKRVPYLTPHLRSLYFRSSFFISRHFGSLEEGMYRRVAGFTCLNVILRNAYVHLECEGDKLTELSELNKTNWTF